ncbi:phosphoglycerate kinase [Rhodohalobacter sp. SW132]|uniref:phosphoglycerate kinase n=1 Tax=Rhodohalobacter sp. SW132 TaxID=2293433 RepID=UPI000E22F1FE|nr:phosphoglycerate kinase [Rhodohalobacter sp. SW132]REL29070.1 phosphoglycerate kinase [Rhodohalobacter sp. SW132]
MAKQTLKDVDLKGKTVLMRVDFNVPIKDGKIGDDNRIVQALESINYVVERGAKLILTSHLGRPGGEPSPEFSLKPVADHLATLVDVPVHFAEDCIGEKAEKVIKSAKEGEIVLLENVRFHPEEKKNDPKFAMKLATHADIFVNDAFGSSHRAHASVAGVTEFLQPSVSGFLLEKEIQYLEDSVNSPSRPFVAILGGAKVSDKIGVIENLISKVDTIIIGGGMTYTFYKAMGLNIGNSLVEDDKVDLAKELMKKAEDKGIDFMLPIDSVVAKEFSNDAEHKVVDRDGIEDGWMALDIGPQSSIAFSNRIKNARTVLWNGPMGVFEMENFSDGTFTVAEALADATANNGAITIIGGGDSAAAIKKSGLQDKVSHVSTGGGASLEYLEGKELPGVASLTNK